MSYPFLVQIVVYQVFFSHDYKYMIVIVIELWLNYDWIMIMIKDQVKGLIRNGITYVYWSFLLLTISIASFNLERHEPMAKTGPSQLRNEYVNRYPDAVK